MIERLPTGNNTNNNLPATSLLVFVGRRNPKQGSRYRAVNTPLFSPIPRRLLLISRQASAAAPVASKLAALAATRDWGGAYLAITRRLRRGTGSLDQIIYHLRMVDLRIVTVLQGALLFGDSRAAGQPRGRRQPGEAMDGNNINPDQSGHPGWYIELPV